jgi:hypothetical protein
MGYSWADMGKKKNVLCVLPPERRHWALRAGGRVPVVKNITANTCSNFGYLTDVCARPSTTGTFSAGTYRSMKRFTRSVPVLARSATKG